MRFKALKSLLLIATLSFAIQSLASIIRPAFLPAVPESWGVAIIGTTVEYTSPVNPKTQKVPKTIVRFTYSRRTNNKDAKTIIDEYVKSNGCKSPKQLGKGFYSASCSNIGRDVVVVGEISNMYTIELSGEYDRIAIDLINTYVNSIVNGKRTFEDREIGEKVVSQ